MVYGNISTAPRSHLESPIGNGGINTSKNSEKLTWILLCHFSLKNASAFYKATPHLHYATETTSEIQRLKISLVVRSGCHPDGTIIGILISLSPATIENLLSCLQNIISKWCEAHRGATILCPYFTDKSLGFSIPLPLKTCFFVSGSLASQVGNVIRISLKRHSGQILKDGMFLTGCVDSAPISLKGGKRFRQKKWLNSILSINFLQSHNI